MKTLEPTLKTVNPSTSLGNIAYQYSPIIRPVVSYYTENTNKQ